MTLRGVLAGCGWIAPSHLRAWSALPEVVIEAVADPDLGRASRLAADFGIDGVFASAAEALNAVRPDFLDIAAGPEVHAELVELGVGVGCHVLCQKPLAFELAAADRIVHAERESGRVVAVNEMWKWLPGYQLARELVAEGLLGPVREARFKAATNLLLPQLDGEAPARLTASGQPAFRIQPRVLLFDYGMHPIDLLRSLLGPEVEVVAASVSRVSPALRGDDGAFLRLRFADETAATIELDWSRPGPPAEETIDDECLTLSGSRGLLTVTGARTLTWYPTLGEGWSRSLIADRRQAAFVASHSDFVSAIIEGRVPASPPSDHIENLRIALVAYGMAGWPA